jgi:hypothetical protein
MGAERRSNIPRGVGGRKHEAARGEGCAASAALGLFSIGARPGPVVNPACLTMATVALARYVAPHPPIVVTRCMDCACDARWPAPASSFVSGRR